jgi:putative zinc finger/helix-turn-helix YgiT family protein
MKCSRCDRQYIRVEKERTQEFRGRSVTVLAQYLQCEGCGELLIDPRDSTDASQRAADAVRRDEGLLTSGEIRSVRTDLGLTQREFEKLLRVGKNTVVRWEAGTVIQSPAIDDKIRAVRDVPEFVRYLARLNRVSIARLRTEASITVQPGAQDVQPNVMHGGSTASAKLTEVDEFSFLMSLGGGRRTATVS